MRTPIACESLETRLFLTTTPNDANYSSEWGLSAVDASTAWDTSTGSAAVVVAGIDSGIDYTHDDLYLNVWINQSEIPTAVRNALADADGDGRISFYDLNASANRDKVNDVDENGRIDAADILTRAKYGGWADGVDTGENGYVDDLVGWDFADDDRNPMDADGHGTHTAGTIGATGNNGAGVAGVNWRVSLMAVKIFGDDGYSATDRAIAAAIRYSADNGARVSNNSWGGNFYSTRIYNAIAYAGTKGQLFVVAAGNDAANLDSRFYNDYPAEFALDNIVVVGATSSSGGRAYYSNYGLANVDVFAPGSGVLSTVPGDDYAAMSGTSMAAPHVAGAAALMLSANGKLTAAQLKSRIIAGADQNSSLYVRSVAGGELNVPNAIANVTGTRYSGSSSSDTFARRFTASRESATSLTSDPAAEMTTPVSQATAPTAPQPLAVAKMAGQVLGASSTAAAAASNRPASRATPARSAFSDRRVSPTSAGYEPAGASQMNVDGVRVAGAPALPPTVVSFQWGGELRPLTQAVPVPLAVAGDPALASGAFEAVAEPGLLAAAASGEVENAASAMTAAVASVTDVATSGWTAGATGRAAVAVAAVTSALAGAYVQIRRKARLRVAAANQPDEAKPVEFTLRP